MAREINLVPDVKGEMIRALKLRNFIFFLCIVVASASIGITVLLGLAAGAQQLAVDGKKDTIIKMSNRIASYTDLKDFLTIKDQLGNITNITNKKRVLSRTFNILSALLPTGADEIKISELSVDLASEEPTFTFDAQANAGREPYIDYNVLDSFKKSMQYMYYDYGDYVDKEGNTIPSYCIIETGDDGALLSDPSTKDIYAYWTIKAEGCNPAKKDEKDESEVIITDYELENYKDQEVVRIWRTPQYSDWYKETPSSNQPSITLNGVISNVAHFNSKCIGYSGEITNDRGNPKWTENNECMLVPSGIDGIKITDSSNGRGAEDELVLRFSATISLNPEAYKFSNHHVIAIPPSGRRNVTDSYVQIQAMFGERAADCEEGDTACNSKENEGEQNG